MPFRVYNHTGWVALLPYIEQDAAVPQYDYNPAVVQLERFDRDQWPQYLAGSVQVNAEVVGTYLRIYHLPPADREPAGSSWTTMATPRI